MNYILYINHIRFRSHITRLFFIGLTSILLSCDNFVELESPDSQINAVDVFNDIQTTEAAIGEIYSKLRDESILTGTNKGIGLIMGLYTDELSNYNNSSLDRQEFFQNTVLPSNSYVEYWWQDSYNLIYSCNRIIEGLSNSTEIPEQKRDQFLGEVIFLRSIIYYYLTELYGDIPYTATTDFQENTNLERTDNKKVLDILITDLLRSVQLLPDTEQSGERIYPTKAAANALLSRLFLKLGDANMAEEYAGKLINSNAYPLDIPLESVFLKNASSTIWQLKPAQPGGNTLEAQAYIFTMTPPPNVALTDDLIDSFQAEDQRFELWIGKLSDSISTYYYPFKYRLNEPGPGSEEYSIVLRIAEQYLIRAEARFILGDLEGAAQDLNAVRSRAGLDTVDQDELSRELIALEWYHEYFTEFGQRFTSLKRLELINEILDDRKPGWDPNDVLLPLPETELIINPNLEPQNPGY